MNLFATLKKIRELEKAQLPFLKSIIDFDLLVEIGYAEEQDQPLTFKQLVLLNIASRATVRRRLLRLIEEGAVRRRRNANDRRSSILTVSASHRKIFAKYGGALTAICSALG
jgi:DNA-binding MarR family transcriptional regulator